MLAAGGCGGSPPPVVPAPGPSLAAPAAGTASAAGIPAPTRLHPEPNVYGLVTLPGDVVTMRYQAGFLDRAARLQFRLEPALKRFDGLGELDRLGVRTYVLSRDEWQRSGLGMPYGVPVRVGHTALAAPADGDDASVRLWADLGVVLPGVASSSLRGTPQQASALALADVISVLQIAEIAVDRTRLGGDAFWVRGFVTHLAAADHLRREEPDTAQDLAQVWRQVATLRPPRTARLEDYRPEMDLAEWLWFQAAFAQAADSVIEDEGRGVLRRLRKLGEDGLTGAELIDRYPQLGIWRDAWFSAF